MTCAVNILKQFVHLCYLQFSFCFDSLGQFLEWRQNINQIKFFPPQKMKKNITWLELKGGLCQDNKLEKIVFKSLEN